MISGRNARLWSAGSALLLVLGWTQSVSAGLDRAIQHLKKAEILLQQGRCAEAVDLANKAIAESPEPAIKREGMFNRTYFPYYIRGLGQLCLKEPGKALDDFRTELSKGRIKSDEAQLAQLNRSIDQAQKIDVTPPRIDVAPMEVMETAFVAENGEDREKATVAVKGVVIDAGGLYSLSIQGKPAKFEKSDEDPDAYRFDAMVTDDATAQIEIVAQDKAGQTTRIKSRTPLPDLNIGDTAKNIYAVIVGVDAYQRSYLAENGKCLPELARKCTAPDDLQCYNFPDLSAAAHDAERFSTLLRRRGVPDSNIRLLVSKGSDRAATRSSIISGLSWLKGSSGEKAIFYFAGHGVLSKGTPARNLIILSDTMGFDCAGRDSSGSKEHRGAGGTASEDGLEATAVGVDEIEAALGTSAFKERYVILDACRTPRAAGTRSGGSERPSEGFSIRGVIPGVAARSGASSVGIPPVTFFATLEEKVSIEWNQKNAGYFTWFLLQGLRRDLPLRTLGPFVQEHVRKKTQEDYCQAPTHECSLVQKPYIEMPSELLNNYELQSRTFVLGGVPRR